MFTGFDLSLSYGAFADSFPLGNKLFSSQQKQFESALDAFIDTDGILSAKKMQSNWFPSIDAQVFISHSHKDIDTAIRLSGWLQKEFGLVAFIDSCVWGYANDLLKLIDDKHCLNSSGKTYSYEKRNRSTSHVHMMLSTALSMMMDKTECLIFLNTPSSITPASVIGEDGTTDSPWIYTEIAMTQLIRQKNPEAHRMQVRADSMTSLAMHESIKPMVKYDINLDHLKKLSENNLIEWKNSYRCWKEKRLGNSWGNPLDALYDIKGLRHE